MRLRSDGALRGRSSAVSWVGRASGCHLRASGGETFVSPPCHLSVSLGETSVSPPCHLDVSACERPRRRPAVNGLVRCRQGRLLRAGRNGAGVDASEVSVGRWARSALCWPAEVRVTSVSSQCSVGRDVRVTSVSSLCSELWDTLPTRVRSSAGWPTPEPYAVLRTLARLGRVGRAGSKVKVVPRATISAAATQMKPDSCSTRIFGRYGRPIRTCRTCGRLW